MKNTSSRKPTLDDRYREIAASQTDGDSLTRRWKEARNERSGGSSEILADTPMRERNSDGLELRRFEHE